MSVAARFNQVFSASLPMTHAISTAPSLTSRPGTDSRDLSIGQRFYRPELDVLRLFAFSVVFCYHIGGDLHSRAPAWIASIIADVLGAGACGVDLFFLLSAYLITELLLREKERTGILNLKAFYVRRIARIWPLYFFFIAIAVAMQWILPGQHLGGKYIAAYFLLAGNWCRYGVCPSRNSSICSGRMSFGEFLGSEWLSSLLGSLSFAFSSDS